MYAMPRKKKRNAHMFVCWKHQFSPAFRSTLNESHGICRAFITCTECDIIAQSAAHIQRQDIYFDRPWQRSHRWTFFLIFPHARKLIQFHSSTTKWNRVKRRNSTKKREHYARSIECMWILVEQLSGKRSSSCTMCAYLVLQSFA